MIIKTAEMRRALDMTCHIRFDTMFWAGMRDYIHIEQKAYRQFNGGRIICAACADYLNAELIKDFEKGRAENQVQVLTSPPIYIEIKYHLIRTPENHTIGNASKKCERCYMELVKGYRVSEFCVDCRKIYADNWDNFQYRITDKRIID